MLNGMERLNKSVVDHVVVYSSPPWSNVVQ